MFALGVSDPSSPQAGLPARKRARKPARNQINGPVRRRAMRSFATVVVACAGLLAGCSLIDRPATPAESERAFQERAAAVAKAWQDGHITTAWTMGFVPLQELTREPAWDPKGDLKASYGNGWIRTTSPLPNTTGRGDIRFADGTSMPVPLVGALTAYSRFPKRSGACPTAGPPVTCQWLTITAARLSTVQIHTTRGLAAVPAWRYTVAGLTQPLMSVAVAPSAITTFPQVTLPGQSAPGGLVSAISLISSSRDVVVFDIGIGACDEDPRGLVRETPELVVVGGSVTPPDAGTSCTSKLRSHRVEVRTTQPVGTRPIVNALSGQPMLTQQR